MAVHYRFRYVNPGSAPSTLDFGNGGLGNGGFGNGGFGPGGFGNGGLNNGGFGPGGFGPGPFGFGGRGTHKTEVDPNTGKRTYTYTEKYGAPSSSQGFQAP
ncbi:hypothetical protein BIW11_12398 [Tropilaelaps mercedesae]|uniref:Uncharacterized protein n=1 Tax=Tropilaelaps mercedesae TaxID=418985 RepID=A0A1V9X6J1_9ACAR|nr:hypothetical protein BIW11_12398 [Tropilaelaps mercedesae]